MKPTLKEEIEMSIKGIDYVNSLEEKDPYSMKTNEIGLSWEIAERAMKNNIPDQFERLKNKKHFNPFILFIYVIIALGTILWTCGIIYLIQKAL